MTCHDLTTKYYNSGGALAPAGSTGRVARVFTGAQLKATILGGGAIPANGDSYKIWKFGPHQFVPRVWTIVTKADDTALTLGIGHIYGSTASATAFEANAALNSTGVTESADDKMILHNVGTGYITITPNTLTAMDDALEFVVVAEVIDLSDICNKLATAMTTPL